MLNEAKTSRPRPRPKIIMKKYQIVIVNIRFKIIAGKNNKIPEFYMIFARKMPDYIIRQRDWGQAEAETKAQILASRPFWPRKLNITEYTWPGIWLTKSILRAAMQQSHDV